MKTFLHVGCGPKPKSTCLGFNNDNWREIRFDIDKDVNPDLVGTLTDMNSVETGTFDAIYSSHNIEHIYSHEVPIALREFYRVLKEDGIVVITCPDLQSLGEALTQDKLFETLFEAITVPEGHKVPITAFDVLFGYQEKVEGNEYMAHKGGFTYSTLDRAFYEAGFKVRVGGRRPEACDLYLVAFKQKKSEEEVKKIAIPFLPEAQF